MRRSFACFSLSTAIFVVFSAFPVLCADAFGAERATPGRQVAMTIEVPKYVAPSRPQTDRSERTSSESLAPEEREAAEKQRRKRQTEAMLSLPPLSDTETQNLSYLLFLPEDYDAKSEEHWPLMLFLHGAGERGTDVEKVKVHGPPKLLQRAEHRKQWPFITVSPQCPPDMSWSPLQLKLLLDEVVKNYRVDRDRVYVTGLSMGGFGTWNMLYHFPDYFAAGAPICGGFTPSAVERFVGKPIWVFHGAKDDVVRVHLSTDVVEAIKAAGGEKVKYTVYPDLQHDSWTVTYENPELYEWFLEQKLKVR